MKRSVSLFLAALMVVSMTALASCDKKEPDTTTGGNNASGNTTSDSTPSSSENKPADSSKPAETDEDPGKVDPPEDGTLYLVSTTAEYKYRVFECQYSASGAGGEYTTDDLADFMATYSWELGDAKLPDEAKEAIYAFEDSAVGPFGDCNVSAWNEFDEPITNNPEVNWAGQNHGLICATTFTIDNLAEFKEKYSEVYVTFWYDNTPSVYLNGDLVMYLNTDCTGNPGDWVDSFMTLDEDAAIYDVLEGTLMDHLVEGENTLVIIMKDAWGGRECCFEMCAE